MDWLIDWLICLEGGEGNDGFCIDECMHGIGLRRIFVVEMIRFWRVVYANEVPERRAFFKAAEMFKLNGIDVCFTHEHGQRPTETKLATKWENVPDFRPVSFEMVDDIERKVSLEGRRASQVVEIFDGEDHWAAKDTNRFVSFNIVSPRVNVRVDTES